MIDNVVYEKKCVRMRKNRIFTTKKYKKIFPNLLGSLPTPIQKSWVRHCCAPSSQNEKSAPLHLCVVSLCVYTVGFIL